MVMAMTGIQSYAASSSSSSSSTSSENLDNQLDKDAFLSLLITQLQNQNPLEPMDNTEYIAQLAQFSSLEQMQQVSQKLDQVAANSSNSAVFALLGHTITYQGTDDAAAVSGVVSAVKYVDGQPMLVINGQEVDPAFVQQVN